MGFFSKSSPQDNSPAVVMVSGAGLCHTCGQGTPLIGEAAVGETARLSGPCKNGCGTVFGCATAR